MCIQGLSLTWHRCYRWCFGRALSSRGALEIPSIAFRMAVALVAHDLVWRTSSYLYSTSELRNGDICGVKGSCGPAYREPRYICGGHRPMEFAHRNMVRPPCHLPGAWMHASSQAVLLCFITRQSPTHLMTVSGQRALKDTQQACSCDGRGATAASTIEARRGN